jgi:predicted lipoprotein with Yx(FWY)xxD motif
MKLRSIIAAPIALVAAGLFLSACGQASQVAGTAQVSAAAAVVSPVASSVAASVPAAAAAAAPAPAALAEVGTLGQVLVGANGNTLYAFTKDVDGVSTCFDACAAAWPAVTVTAGFTPPVGVDPALVSTVDRPDGSKQLKIGKWPLYFYAGDGGPGEANGQGVGGVWFVEGADGKLVKGDQPASQSAAPQAAAAPAPAPAPAAAPAPAPAAAPAAAAPAAVDPAAPVVSLAPVGNLGEVMVGANGHTLYAFTNDPEKQTTCFDACAQAWPPLTVQDGFTISDELQASGASVIDRPDGTKQLAMGKWALYYYAGDGASGDANGQGVNGKWFAIDGRCKLVKTDA